MRILAVVLVLVFVGAFVLAPGTVAQGASDRSVAVFTVRVSSQPPTLPNQAAAGRPKIEQINGHVVMTLEKQHSGQTFEIAQGNYIVLRFPAESGAVGFQVSPPGIFRIPKGIVHLPLHTLGLLKAENPGTATITVQGLAPIQPGTVKFPTANGTWSGYVIPDGVFSSAVGQWTVPTAYGDGGDNSGTWVGIDGVGSNSLIQVGTAQQYSHGFLGTGLGGGPSYYAWYQVLPADDGEITIPKSVSPGDQISAFVLYGGTGAPTPGSAATWYIYVNNMTQNWFFTKTVTYSGPLNSAEWIEEAPTYCDWTGCSVQQLADYGSVTFDAGDYVNVGPPNFLADEEWEIKQGSKVVSVPSDPDGDRDGFTVAYGSDQPSPPGPLILTTSLPVAYVNLPYRQALVAAGSPTFVWLSSTLPAWLSLDPNTGVRSGTPSAQGIYFFDVQAADASQANVRTQMQALSLTVETNPPPPDFSLSASPTATYLVSGACTGNTTVTVAPLYGFGGIVALSIADAAGSYFDPPTTSTTSRLTVHSAPCTAGAPPRLLTITGRSGAIVHTIAVTAVPPVKQTCPDVPAGRKPLPYCP